MDFNRGKLKNLPQGAGDGAEKRRIPWADGKGGGNSQGTVWRDITKGISERRSTEAKMERG